MGVIHPSYDSSATVNERGQHPKNRFIARPLPAS